MILIVNTLMDSTSSAELRDFLEMEACDFEIIDTQQMKISHCIGCNECWLKTPGICTMKDDYEVILKKMIEANQLWVISDTCFGFLSHTGKNIFDRMMPLLTMYLKFKDGQMRHVMRYENRPDIGIVYRGSGNQKYLERWCERTARNMDSRSLGVYPMERMKEGLLCIS